MTAVAANPIPFPAPGGTLASWRGVPLARIRSNVGFNPSWGTGFSGRPVADTPQFLRLGKLSLADAAVAAQQRSLDMIGRGLVAGGVVANPPVLGVLQAKSGVLYATILSNTPDSTTHGYGTTPKFGFSDARALHGDLRAVVTAQNWFDLRDAPPRPKA